MSVLYNRTIRNYPTRLRAAGLVTPKDPRLPSRGEGVCKLYITDYDHINPLSIQMPSSERPRREAFIAAANNIRRMAGLPQTSEAVQKKVRLFR
jgi:hypothetical protein